MKQQLDERSIQKCNINCSVDYVIHHRAVFREKSASSKTRTIYDASSQEGSNKYLNECIFSVEYLNLNLVHVILNFMRQKNAFIGDLARAFQEIYLCFFCILMIAIYVNL